MQKVGKQLQPAVLLVMTDLFELILAVDKFPSAAVGKQRVVIRIVMTSGRSEKGSEVDVIFPGVLKEHIRGDAKRNIG